MHIRRLRGVRDGDDEPDRCRESEDASVEHDECEKRKQQHVANVSLGLSRARRGRFLRRVDAVSCASDDVRRVKVRVVRPDSEESRIQFGILRGVDENRVTTKLLAGGCSGALAAFTLNPTELVKTRRMKGDSWQTIRTQVARDGVSSLWRGSSMAASRAALLTASQVAAYGEVKRLWIQMVPNAKDDWMAHVGASAAAGLITTATTNPVDVVKTRMFISGEGEEVIGERGGDGSGS